MIALKCKMSIACALVILLNGCSSTTSILRSSSTDSDLSSKITITSSPLYDQTSSPLYDQVGFESIINSVRSTESTGKLKAWRKVHNVNGKSDSDAEKKFDELSVNSNRVLSYYSNASTIKSYLYETPCKVLANDNVTLVVIPNSWIWGGSYSDISIVAKPYIKELGQFIGRNHYSTITLSYLNNDSVILNKGSLSSARAKTLAKRLDDAAGLSKGTIPNVGLGEKFGLEAYMVNSTIVELRPTQPFDSSNFTPKEKVNEFTWNG